MESSTKATCEAADCGVGLTTWAERPCGSDVSNAEKSTSKLNTLLKESDELANEIYEDAEGGRDKTGRLRWSSA
jgi:hypothetical protein